MADSRAKARWDRMHTVQVNLKLNRRLDADIIAALQAGGGSMAGEAKRLIRFALQKDP